MSVAEEVPTTRRPLILQRMRGLLHGLDRARRQPNRREAYHLCEALEHLQAGRMEEAAEATGKAERIEPVPPEVALQFELNATPTIQQLLAALDRLPPQ
jgi:hypothetical protein